MKLGQVSSGFPSSLRGELAYLLNRLVPHIEKPESQDRFFFFFQ